MTRPLYDIAAPDFADRAYSIYREMRDEQPLYVDERGRFAALSRYQDVVAVLNDSERFSNEGVSTSVGALPILQQIDGKLHHELRALVVVAFTPRRIADLEPHIRESARGLIAAFAGRGECDLMADYARHLPSMAIAKMVGVPEEQRVPMLEWTEALVGIQENGDVSVDQAAMAVAELFRSLLEERRRAPQDDLMSALLDAEIEGGRRLSEEEVLGFLFQLILAGNDTTTNLIANGAVLLGANAAQRAELVAEPSLLPNAVEEMMRIESPTQVLPRRVTQDLELHGRPLRAGSELRVIYAAANRDERFFEEPDRFDIHRPNARRHLALGQGAHFCLGAALARLEGRIAFEELLSAIPDYEVAGDTPWMRSAWARAHTRVPLRFPVNGSL